MATLPHPAPQNDGIGAVLRGLWSHPLNRRFGRLSAVMRFASWQARQRLRPRVRALPFVAGSHLLVTRGQEGATGNWYSGLDEPAEMAFALHLLRPDDLFLDVGANIGSYTVLAAAGAGCEVIALEPGSEAFEALAQNIAANNIRATPIRAAASDQPGAARLSCGLSSCNHILTDFEDGPNEAVPTTTIDAQCERAPTLIKIDIEGHELRALAGATATLASPRLLAVVIETNGSRQCGLRSAIVNLMAVHGFSPYSYDPFKRQLVEWDGTPNTIFVRDPLLIAERVRTAGMTTLVNGQI